MLILTTGLPGVGKSMVARALAQELGADVFNSDEIRRELFPKKRTYSREETGEVIAEMKNRVRRALEEKRVIILDALFTKERARDEYRKLAEEMTVPFRVVYVSAGDDTVRARMEKRARTDDPSEADFAVFLDRKKHFEQPTGDPFEIHNDGTLGDMRAQLQAVTKSIRG